MSLVLAPGVGPAGAEPAAGRPAVVVVPGITGTGLREAASGMTVWGRGGNLFQPRDFGYGLARRLEKHESARSNLAVGPVIEQLTIGGIFRKPIYGPLVEAFERAGYRHGSLEAPRLGGDFFLFGYDWRLDNIRAAQLLAAQLEALRRARAAGPLDIVLICQSNGAAICRYLVKYGDASMEEAEDGEGGLSPLLVVRRVILVGASNGGNLQTLRDLLRGRRYIPGIGRHFQAETLFSFRSLYQNLPAYRGDLILDERGRTLPIDIYDVRDWIRHQWSIFSGEAERRMADVPEAAEKFGDADLRRSFLESALSRAVRFQRLLRRDGPAFVPAEYFMIQGAMHPTPERAVLTPRGEGWDTWFTGDPELDRRPELAPLASAMGDGQATLASQAWLSPQEEARVAAAPSYIEADSHFQLIIVPETHARLIELVNGSGG